MSLRPMILFGIAISAMLILQSAILYEKYNKTTAPSLGTLLSQKVSTLTDFIHGLRNEEKEDKRWLTIAIPTIERQNGTYFFTMLESLLSQTEEEQLHEIYVVVFLADIFKEEWKNKTEETLRQKYSNLFENGTLRVIRAPREVYSGYDPLANHTQRWHWTVKQNYDYAFMMRYCHKMSDYYLQMEDDVVTKKGYLKDIKDFIKKKEKEKWTTLYFSDLGYVGKLYRSGDIIDLAEFLILFQLENPVDWNGRYFHEIKGQTKQGVFLRKPTLFQHIGYHSSLPNKIQKLKDPFFRKE